MKADASFPINKTTGMAIFIIVLLLTVVFIFMIPTALGGVNDTKKYSIEKDKEKQLEDLNGFYNAFKKTDGGFDSYEASVLLAKVIEYTWKDCANFCEKATDVADFTNFFLTHPIALSKTLDCDAQYVYHKDTKYKISKDRISGYCKDTDLGITDATKSKRTRVDEWTTTIWGLYRNSAMCTNYIADGDQWGNMYCGDAETDKIKCTPLCGTGKDWTHEITQDRIKSWEGVMVQGKAYSNIKVVYNPDCTYVKGFLPFSKQACLEVQIGAGTDIPASGGDLLGTESGGGSGSQCPAVSGTSGYTCTDSSTCSKFGGCSVSGKCPTPGEICCKQPPC